MMRRNAGSGSKVGVDADRTRLLGDWSGCASRLPSVPPGRSRRHVGVPARLVKNAGCTCATQPEQRELRSRMREWESAAFVAYYDMTSREPMAARRAHEVDLSSLLAVSLPAAQVVELRNQKVEPPKHRIPVPRLPLCWLGHTAPVYRLGESVVSIFWVSHRSNEPVIRLSLCRRHCDLTQQPSAPPMARHESEARPQPRRWVAK